MAVRNLVVAAFAAALLAPAAAHASPEDIFGYGPRSIGMAGTGAAAGRGFDTVYTNPALLSLSRDRTLSVGWMGAMFALQAAQPVRGEAVSGTIIGGTLPLPFEGSLKDRLTLGIGFFTPFELVARARILYPETPKFLLPDRTQSVAVQLGLGAHVVGPLRVGVGFAALAGLAGKVVVATDASGRVGTVVENTLVASYGPIVGASVDLGPWRLGATYRGELKARFDVVIEVRDLGGITVPPLHISGIAQYDPHQVQAEVARDFGDWTWALGATWRHWSAYPGAVEATVRCPEPPDDTRCDPLVPPPAGYSDTVSPRLAVEHHVAFSPKIKADLRAGYAFEPTPAPEQTGVENTFDNHRSVFSLGYGVGFQNPLPFRMDLFGQIHFLHERAHDKKDSDRLVYSRGFMAVLGATVGVTL